VDAECSRFIRRRRHDTTIPGYCADDDRPLPILRVIALFTTREERIEIDVCDPTIPLRHY
jgi:hypothetical protein